jgi:hypothetical protein
MTPRDLQMDTHAAMHPFLNLTRRTTSILRSVAPRAASKRMGSGTRNDLLKKPCRLALVSDLDWTMVSSNTLPDCVHIRGCDRCWLATSANPRLGPFLNSLGTPA